MSLDIDIGPLSWVKSEIDLALERAAQALTEHDQMPAGGGLASAVKHLHQAHGALAIVGLDGVTEFADAIESLFAKLTDGTVPWSADAEQVAQHGLAALRGYLDGLMAGEYNQPLKLNIVYRDLRLASGEPEPSPAALFFPDLTQRPPRREVEPAALSGEKFLDRLKLARMGYERGLLKWIKGDAKGVAEMRNAVAMIELAQIQPADRALWWSALGFFAALAANGFADPAAAALAKKLAMRLGAEIKHIAGATVGAYQAPERLLADVLYLVATAQCEGDAPAALGVVCAAYRLDELIPRTTHGNFEALRPLRRRLRELLASAKEDWNRLCVGSAAALPPFHEKISQLNERVVELEQDDLSHLFAAMSQLADALRRDPSRHNDSMALEMATAMLLADAALENFEALDAEFAAQGETVAERLSAVLRGEALGEFAIPHLDAMSRRAQERLLLTSVCGEISANLGLIEQTLDAYFRDPQKRASLVELHKPLTQIDGALAMLGQDRAGAMLADCRRQIDALKDETCAPAPTVFEDIAQKLSALGFFIEQFELGQQPDIDRILNPQGANAPVQPVSEPVPASAVPPAPTLVESEPAPALPVEPPVVLAELVTASVEPAIEAELLEIFLEEAGEVLATIAEQLPRVHAVPADKAALTTLRRSFHTLKGSGRMVGLGNFGEVAWAVEQALNRWVTEGRAATPALLEMIDVAAKVFAAWTAQLAAGGSSDYPAATVCEQCAQLMGEEAADGAVIEVAAEVPAIVEPSAIEMAAAMEARELAREEAELASAELEIAQIQSEQALGGAGSQTGAEAEPAVALTDTAIELSTEVPSLPPVDDDELLAAELAAAEIEAEGAAARSDESGAEMPVPAAGPSTETSAEIHSFPAPPPVHIGELSISPVLYAIYLEEARQHLATLQHELGQQGVPSDAMIRAAHTLASTSGTTGVTALHFLARAMEAAFGALAIAHAPPTEAQRLLFARCVGALEGMLGAVAERRMPGEESALANELAVLKPEPGAGSGPAASVETVASPTEFALPARSQEAPATLETDGGEGPETAEERRARRMGDDIDVQLLPLFLEESVDLMASIDAQLRAWRHQLDNPQFPRQLQRDLHTLKGSARMAGAMGIGELTHSMESRIEQAVTQSTVGSGLIDGLETSYDRVAMLVDRLQRGDFEVPADAETTTDTNLSVLPATAVSETVPGLTLPQGPAPIAQVQLRVRADLVDKLVNEAGEVAIARARIEGEMRALKQSLLELTDNVIRLRHQVREIEMQAETQIASQLSELKTQAAEEGRVFDPLELDRFTRFQELTRMMAESVNDVSTVQHTLLGNLNHADAALQAQARLNRDLSQRLMAVRMVPFESLAERLHRVVRQAAKDCGKRANLDIRGGQMGIDRSVIEHIGGPLEHLLRNAVAHGLESPAERETAAKPALGQITISLAQEGNDVVLSLSDDGAGLDFARIRELAQARGLIAAGAVIDDKKLVGLIFESGFSTASEVTQLSGRGVGMDVVKNEIEGLGGHIEVATVPGQGSTFRLYLPLTLAVSQAVIITLGSRHYALPSSMIEQASEMKPDAIAAVRTAGGTEHLGRHYPYFYLPRLLGEAEAQPAPARRHWLLLVKGGTERLAIEIDGMVGNQEIVIKHLGPQLARVPGIAGATVLSDGEIALILNPVALLSRQQRQGQTGDRPVLTDTQIKRHSKERGSVMVVDDSLTVRKITGRLLGRQGYNVLTAKDGVDALEQLAEVRPGVMLVDIEMPRMDGFELTRVMRADERLKGIPVIMITSRSADKHRQHALALGVNHYLGKPFDEARLLALIAAELEPSQENIT